MLFDLREQIEAYLLNLIPSKYQYNFDFGFALPSSVKKATLGIFAPRNNCELRVGAKTEIDLLPNGFELEKPEVDASVRATLGAFDIKLVGDFFDAVTLKFSDAEFVSDLGDKSDFRLTYEDFEIGEMLQFIQDLQSYLTPKEGSGAYIKPLRGTPGIEAGYGLSLGTIMIGNISFSNISLNASAEIPFTDDRGAYFKASLSRRDAPFTIAYAPYGGSGFFAVVADAKGIIGFEMSLEFGGAGAFAAGPLTGQGRIMAGFYIRSLKVEGLGTVTEITATFFAGGSASIWIFNFSASLYLRLGMKNGNMTGLAIFSFSFSMGLADFDYSVRFEKTENKGFGGDGTQRQSSLRSPFQPNENADQNDNVVALFASSEPDGGGLGSARPVIETDVECQSCDWRTYSSYFDESLDFEECF